jgi:hypothetical protein
MKLRTGKRTKDGAALISMAGSIGSTLGTIVARAKAVQKALTRSSVEHTVRREGKETKGKSTSFAHKVRNAASTV